MKTTLKGMGIEITDAISAYCEKRLGKIATIVDAHSDSDEVLVRVDIGKETKHHEKGDVFVAEMQMHFLGKDLRDVIHEADLYAAIDACVDGLLREVVETKAKHDTLVKKGGREIKEKLKGE